MGFLMLRKTGICATLGEPDVNAAWAEAAITEINDLMRLVRHRR